MKNVELKIPILFFLIIGVLFKFVICFFIGSVMDLPRYTYVGNYLNLGWNPYTDHDTFPINFYNKYPAFFFEILAGWFYVFGNTLLSLRFLFFLFEMLTTYFLYLIGMKLNNKELGYTFAIIYLFLPFNFIAFLNGENDSIALFFVTASFYYFIKERHFISSILLGFGICFKIYPLFLLLCYCIYFFKKGQLKILIFDVVGVGIVFLLTSLPFLILSPEDYIQCLLVHTKRMNTGIQFNFLFGPLFNLIPIDLYFYTVSISWNFIIQAIVIISLTIYFLWEKHDPQISDVIRWGLGYLILLLIIMMRGHVANWMWISPFLIIRLFHNRPNVIHENQFFFLITICCYIIALVSTIIWYVNLPYNIFQTYLDMVDLEYFIQFVILNDDPFTIFEFFKFMPLIIWAVYFIAKKKYDSILGIICAIAISDRVIFALLKTMCNSEFCLISIYIYFFVRLFIITTIDIKILQKRWKLPNEL